MGTTEIPAEPQRVVTLDMSFVDAALALESPIVGYTLYQEKGAEMLEKILAVASGEKTKSEGLGLGDNEFVPWQVGAVM